MQKKVVNFKQVLTNKKSYLDLSFESKLLE